MSRTLKERSVDVLKNPPISASAAVSAFDNLLNAWKDCKITSEIERTKRENIRSWRDVNVKAIEESSDILRRYLELSFKERAETISGVFERLDRALEDNNTEAVCLMVNSIVTIVKDSPLAQARQVISDMNNHSVSMIEI